MNLPNKLTVARIVMVPFFVAFLLTPAIPHHYLLAGLVFGAASLTDHYDGKLARKNNQITTFGKFLDPLADKILVISALVCFVALGLAPTWCVLLIIAREFMVTSIRLVAVEGGKVIAANNWGKTKTVSQIIAISAILLLQYLQELSAYGILPPAAADSTALANACLLAGNLLIYVAVFFTVLSGVIYIKENIGAINTME